MLPRDEKHRLIYNELVNALGADYVSDDPAVTQAYSRDFYAVGSLYRRSQSNWLTATDSPFQ